MSMVTLGRVALAYGVMTGVSYVTFTIIKANRSVVFKNSEISENQMEKISFLVGIVVTLPPS